MRTPPLVLLALSLLSASPGMAQTRYAPFANLSFPNGYPTAESAARLNDELLFQRATQVYLWALPAVNLMAMKEASQQAFGAGYNIFPVWKERLNAKTLVTTPNSDVIYAMTYVDVGKDGPLVIEIPPQQQGILDDFWQRPIPGPTVDGKTYAGDVGLAGPDKGKGGKFVVLPPGYRGNLPDGYYVYRSRTNNVFVFWRAFFKDPKDLGPPNRLIEQTRIYPLGKKAEAKPMQFPDASGKPLDMLYPRDSRYFDMLSRFVAREAIDPADTDWRGMMAAVGIVKGQPFKPDAHARAILDAAARTAFEMSRVMVYANLEKKPAGRIYDDRHYVDLSRGGAADYEWLDIANRLRDLDTRTSVYSIAYSTSPAMLLTAPGQGARYLPAFKSADGQYLSGDENYRLHLPPHIPAAIFWSVTLYDAATASGLDNGLPFPSVNTMDKPATNADGSVDFYVGPNSPGAGKNWLRTVPGKGFFMIVRLYGPTQGYFDKSWRPSDLELVK